MQNQLWRRNSSRNFVCGFGIGFKLSKSRINIETFVARGTTPLFDALRSDKSDAEKTRLINALLNAGARPDTPFGDGGTALMWAAGAGYSKVVETLLQHGANPHSHDAAGKTPLDYARKGSHPACIALLR